MAYKSQHKMKYPMNGCTFKGKYLNSKGSVNSWPDFGKYHSWKLCSG